MPSRKVKLGILLPTRGLLLRNQQPTSIERLIGLAERAEQGGLDGVWVGDSLVAKPRMEPLSVLSALAVRTSRVRLGTAVLLPVLRHPVLLAQTLATVELISEGRMVIGAGVGGAFNEDQKQEWEAAGVPSKGRGRRFNEIIEIISGLGSGEPFAFNGKDFKLDSTLMRPVPARAGGIPFLLATHYRARSQAQICRAARLGSGIISISDTPEEFRQVIEQVNKRAAELGRNPETLEKAFIEAREKFGDDPPRPPHWGGFALKPGSIEFWQGGSHRLHDRFLFERTEAGGWSLRRLYP